MVGKCTDMDIFPSIMFRVRTDFHALISSSFSLAFQCVIRVLLHCLPAHRCHQQSPNCKAVVLQWTLTTVGCQFRLHLLLHHLQSSWSAIDADVSKAFCIIFSRKRDCIKLLLLLLFIDIPKVQKYTN